MTVLLEIREKIKLIYSRYEAFILPVVKFLLAFLVLNTLNGRMGYMTQLDNIAVVLIVSLMCSFLPTGCIVLFAALFSLLHMYSLSMEVLLVGFCVYLVMFLLFFRFSPKDSLVVILTPLLFALKIPYVVPIAVGLLCGPASVVSVGCGVVVHYLLQTVSSNASTINTMGEAESTAKIRLMIDGIIGNKGMIVVIAAFVITVLVVYLIRRMSIDYAWTIAMMAGAMTNVVILLVGDLIYDTNISVAGALLGSLLSVIIAKVIEFFRFCVDYSRTEKVQFEDDEYYYYVKAVPKMSVAMSTRTVKKINTQRSRNGMPAGRGGTAASQYRGQSGRSTGRSVTTERTAPGNRSTYGATGRPTGMGNGKSVTIGSTSDGSVTGNDDYEELF
ncbi:MAG: hypothetical protein ACI4AB_10890 [Acetatifactor sp.]